MKTMLGGRVTARNGTQSEQAEDNAQQEKGKASHDKGGTKARCTKAVEPDGTQGSIGGVPAAQSIHRHREDDHQSLHDELPEIGDIHQGQSVVQHGNHQCAP
jgi:hypothetical protein